MFKYLVLIFTAFLIFGWFYWFQFRPTIIHKECGEFALKEAKSMTQIRSKISPDNETYNKAMSHNLYKIDDYNTLFHNCLQKNGLNK